MVDSNHDSDSESESDGVDDYMSMPLGDDAVEDEDPQAPQQPKSGVETDPSHHKPYESERGLRLLKLMGGYKPQDNKASPLVVDLKKTREGIGAETAKKREWDEAYGEHVAKSKVAKQEHVETKSKQSEDRRLAKMLINSQHILLDFETDRDPDKLLESDNDPTEAHVTIRGLVVDHREREAWKAFRNARMHQNSKETSHYVYEGDDELEKFRQLELQEQVNQVVARLREKYLYCYWCGFRYKTQEEMDEDCPGVNEADHDIY